MERRLVDHIMKELIMRQFISALVIAGMCASGSAVFAQDSGAKEETKKAGEATKARPRQTPRNT